MGQRDPHARSDQAKGKFSWVVQFHSGPMGAPFTLAPILLEKPFNSREQRGAGAGKLAWKEKDAAMYSLTKKLCFPRDVSCPCEDTVFHHKVDEVSSSQAGV